MTRQQPPRSQVARRWCDAMFDLKELERAHGIVGQAVPATPAHAWPLLAERLGTRVVVEGVAEDGTIEAIRIAEAPGFALGVQWHAEYDPQRNPINGALFRAFGEALAAHKRAV